MTLTQACFQLPGYRLQALLYLGSGAIAGCGGSDWA